MSIRTYFCWIGFLLLSSTGLVRAQSDAYNLLVNVQQIGHRQFATQASFTLPLKQCQAWHYLTDYESATAIPGVLSSEPTRLSSNKVTVKLAMKENILFFPIHMHSELEFLEMPNYGTDFVQIAGEAKSFHGSWRIEPGVNGTLFSYHSVFEPDSALPMVVIQYFLERRLRHRFTAMAQYGATQQNVVCD
jgi:Polyketide cyclase / dehydrase and lipid transport